MPEIREYIVVEPPTSGEVQGRAVNALSEGILRLTVLALQEIPRPEEEVVELTINQTLHPREGGMDISGHTIDGVSVVIRAPFDAEEPATASIVGEL